MNNVHTNHTRVRARVHTHINNIPRFYFENSNILFYLCSTAYKRRYWFHIGNYKMRSIFRQESDETGIPWP